VDAALPRCTKIVIGCLSGALLAGCGNSRTAVPALTRPLAPAGFRTVRYPTSGVVFRAPSNWLVVGQQAPMVAIASSGSAIVSIWRFTRSGPPPNGKGALTRARTRLLGEARSRDSTLKLIRTKLARVDGAPAVELDALERITGQTRRVRSIHIYPSGAEVVLEEYAPPSVFHAVDHAVFSPIKRSLTLIPL
jgi:hypothetical protein